jgi:hypothetical protein
MTRRISPKLFEEIQLHMQSNTYKSYVNWVLWQVKFNNLKRKQEKAVLRWEYNNGIALCPG